jgi:formylmethanofuran dehydrogenase subunit D
MFMKKVEVTLISGRTSQQGSGLEVGKTSDEYFNSTSYVELSTEDAEALDLEDGLPVEVNTDHGSVVVTGRVSKELDSGLAFFPYGPWANRVFGSTTEGTGMPAYKGIRASLCDARDAKVKTLTELVEEMGGKGL